MALIKCPECNKTISDLAINCPNCGFPLQEVLFSSSNVGDEQIPYLTDKLNEAKAYISSPIQEDCGLKIYLDLVQSGDKIKEYVKKEAYEYINEVKLQREDELEDLKEKLQSEIEICENKEFYFSSIFVLGGLLAIVPMIIGIVAKFGIDYMILSVPLAFFGFLCALLGTIALCSPTDKYTDDVEQIKKTVKIKQGIIASYEKLLSLME